MVTIVELDSWLDFEKIIEGRLLKETQIMMAGFYGYRGHSDSTWQLETTLERSTKSHLTVESYYRIIDRIQTKIETFTDQKWDLPSYQDFIRSFKLHPSAANDPLFVYMTYLRHFGFPSPLLDWSYSPFVAAYFAFKDITSEAKSVAIYELYADFILASFSVTDCPQIFPITASPRKNKRHELQQSFYTICIRESNDRIYYDSHENQRTIKQGGEPITKYILPASERAMALHSLDAYNINAYSLFGTEESLLETLFLEIYKVQEMSIKMYGSDQYTKWS